MRVGTKEGNKEIFLESLRHFPEELRKFCVLHGLELEVPPAWPLQAAAIISRANRALEITTHEPGQGRDETDQDNVWRLDVEENLGGTRVHLGRWPAAWRRWDYNSHRWADVEFGVVIERILSEFFNVGTAAREAGV